MKWKHSRKGMIKGEILRQDGGWTWIMLDGDHEPHMMSEANQGTVWNDGEVVQVRTSFLTPLP